MSKFCTQCGAVAADDAKWCNQCGNALRTPPITEAAARNTEKPQTSSEPTKVNQDTDLKEELLKASTPESKVAAEAAAEPRPKDETASVATPTAPQSTAAPEEKTELHEKTQRNVPPQQKRASAPKKAKSKKPEKAKKDGKKKKKALKGLLIVAIILLVISALVGIFFFCFGDYLSLKSHSAEVVEEFNDGDFNKLYNKEIYEDLPLYVLEMMGETKDTEEPSPILKAMSPYITFEVVDVSAFMGKGKVEYRVVSRDLCEFIVSADTSEIETVEEFQQIIIEHIPEAPVKEYYVTVEYGKEDYGWKGDYNTAEFTDAITGGMNMAYNKAYEAMLEEMEELLNE